MHLFICTYICKFTKILMSLKCSTALMRPMAHILKKSNLYTSPEKRNFISVIMPGGYRI